MQSEFVNIPPTETVSDNSAPEMQLIKELIWFRTNFMGCMEMLADAQTVANYLDVHEGWFRRCARPMTAEPLGKNGYALTIGRYGALGYEVEPKVGLNLLPQEEGVYRILTIPIPDYTPPGYEVDFQAVQILNEINENDLGISTVMTRVEWKLNLAVGVMFPKFIRALPISVIEKTGDRLLAQIVKQVSRRLTYKVQEDFHTTLGEEALKNFRKMYSITKGKNACQQC